MGPGEVIYNTKFVGFCLQPTAPRGEQWKLRSGGDGKGPAAWPDKVSTSIDEPTKALCSTADLRFLHD